jgi:hypothetical protein
MLREVSDLDFLLEQNIRIEIAKESAVIILRDRFSTADTIDL